MSFSPLDEFFERLLDSAWFPTVRYQSSNPSTCAFGPIDSECQVRWRPISRENEPEERDALLDGLESLPTEKRETLTKAVQFVTSYWSAPLDCRFGYDRVVLDCGAWNQADLSRKCIALKDSIDSVVFQQETPIIPIAWPSADSGFYIGLNSDSGEVVMTEIGITSGERLAASLEDFLAGLRPVTGYFSETVQSF